MEPMSAVLEGEWRSLSGIYTNEESDFMAQLIHNYSVQNHQNELDQDHNCLIALEEARFDDTSLRFSDNTTSNNYSISSHSSLDSNTSFYPSLHYETCYFPNQYLAVNDDLTTMDFCLGVEIDDCLINQDHIGETEVASIEESYKNLPEISQLEIESQGTLLPDLIEDDSMNHKNKKRTRPPNVEKNKRNVKSRKNTNLVEIDDKKDMQSTSSCSSEDISNNNTSQELNKDSKTSKGKNSSGKTRASRGSATDPQSLYARKRRERINERLKILQNLVPNGTKVDISTMLEEAVQYVNFLQLQIKLLSSNDLWMYSPIAYNGMDIGLDFSKVE